MNLLLAVSGGIDALNRRIGHAVYWLILAAVLVSAGNAVSRYLFDLSSNAWLELQWYLFSAVFLLAAGYTLLHNEHVRIDVVFGHLRPRLRAWIDLIGGIFFLLPMSVIIMVLSWPIFVDSFADQRIFERCRRAAALAGQAADAGRLSAAGAARGLGNHQADRLPARTHPRSARKAP